MMLLSRLSALASMKGHCASFENCRLQGDIGEDQVAPGVLLRRSWRGQF